MGCLNVRCFVICVLCLQLVAIVERQVFDFLGYMWSCILANFLQIIFVIIGLFGIAQRRAKIVIAYLVWCFLWLGWNIFIMCLYLEAGILKKADVSVLNMATGSISWWALHGYGCRTVATLNDTFPSTTSVAASVLPTTVPRTNVISSTEKDNVVNCLIAYEYVEVLHAAIECALVCISVPGVCIILNRHRLQYQASLLQSQLVSGELEYIRMQHPSSLDRRNVPAATHPHQIYDVPRSSAISRPIVPDDVSTKSIRLTENTDRHSTRSGSNRSASNRSASHRQRLTTPPPPRELDTGRPAQQQSQSRTANDELPYAVSGMAMRLPPLGRRTHDSRTGGEEQFGIVLGGTQIPEATFI